MDAFQTSLDAVAGYQGRRQTETIVDQLRERSPLYMPLICPWSWLSSIIIEIFWEEVKRGYKEALLHSGHPYGGGSFRRHWCSPSPVSISNIVLSTLFQAVELQSLPSFSKTFNCSSSSAWILAMATSIWSSLVTK